jgi:O-acetyl-ADP-ribose deacetylase (regulator of RNase III)
MFVKICRSVLKVVLVDIKPQVVRAWQAAFADTPEAEIVHGSILNQTVDAWVTPTNARGRMDGGVDAVIKHHLGPQIEKRVREEIGRLHRGRMPVGHATCVPTGVAAPRFLISTPTMVASSEDISDTVNVALASAAAFQAIHMQNAIEPDSITSVALPGLGAATGRVPPNVCADLMWTGYTLFNDGEFQDFEGMRGALHERLGNRGPVAQGSRVRIEVPDAARELLRPAFLMPG